MDSDMEKLLTKYIVALNKRGRPPTRGEVKNLGQILTNVPEFRASKGWLDKYLSRIQDYTETKGSITDDENFKLLSYADLRRTESKKPILLCLAEIGLSEELIQKFKDMSHEKFSNLAEDSFEENNDEQEPEPETEPEAFLLNSQDKHFDYQKHFMTMYHQNVHPHSIFMEEDIMDKLKADDYM